MNQQQQPRPRVFWQLGRRQTYRRALYVLLSVPSGLVYWLVLLGMGGLDLLSAAPRLLRREHQALNFLHARASWRRLANWERRHAMRWLGVELPPFQQPPPASLAFLLLKLPLAYPVAFGAIAGLVYAGLMMWLAGQRIASAIGGTAAPAVGLLQAAGAAGLSIAVVITVPLVLNLLAVLWSRLAVFAYGDRRQQLRDAQARAAAEQSNAERADRSRRDLIMNVGHELRTPTASIRGHVESLLLALEDDPAQPSDEVLRDNLAIMQREAERLGMLIDDLLALARNETDKLHLELRPLAGGEIVEEAYGTLAPLARCERRVTLVREVEPGLPLLLADRRRLLQVLLNLVRNAVTYTPGGGIVAIVLRRDGDAALLAVRDTGVGIPEHELERIFERFHRVDQSRTRSSGGFGLGLAIVRDLVEAMGGTVTANSVEGQGSSFEVRLPLAPAAAPSPRPSASDQGA